MNSRGGHFLNDIPTFVGLNGIKKIEISIKGLGSWTIKSNSQHFKGPVCLLIGRVYYSRALVDL